MNLNRKTICQCLCFVVVFGLVPMGNNGLFAAKPTPSGLVVPATVTTNSDDDDANENVELYDDSNQKLVLKIKDTGRLDDENSDIEDCLDSVNSFEVVDPKNTVKSVIIKETLFPVKDIRRCCNFFKKLETLHINYGYDQGTKGAIYSDAYYDNTDVCGSFSSVRSLYLKKGDTDDAADDADEFGFFEPKAFDALLLSAFPHLESLTVIGALLVCGKADLSELAVLLKKYAHAIKKIRVQATRKVIKYVRKNKATFAEYIDTLKNDLKNKLGSGFDVSIEIEKPVFGASLNNIYDYNSFITVKVVPVKNVFRISEKKMPYFDRVAPYTAKNKNSNFSFKDLKINFSK